jgi:hypothetical protein
MYRVLRFKLDGMPCRFALDEEGDLVVTAPKEAHPKLDALFEYVNALLDQEDEEEKRSPRR